MRTKAFAAHIKAAGEQDGLQPGQFEAVVSVFGNIDYGGDVVMPGAFSRSLAEWKASGDPLPVIWDHQKGDPEAHIGYVVEAAELLPGDERLPEKIRDNGGLWVRGQLDLDEPKAAKVHRLLKGRRVKQFSFSYDIVKGAPVEWQGEKAYGLYDLDVFEVGPTLLGMNARTDLVGAKAGPCPTCGHTIDGKATATAPAKDEEPAGAKSEEPRGAAPARVRLFADLDLLDVG